MPEPSKRTRPEWEPIGGAAFLHEDYTEPPPRRTALTGARNGLPGPVDYTHGTAGRARELEVARQLEAIREQALRHVATQPMTFRDPITGDMCELVAVPEVGVKHPRCARLADLCAELDAFYCPQCRMNGRINGAWAIQLVKIAQAIALEKTPESAESGDN